MRALLLGLATFAVALPAPAVAESTSGTSFIGQSGSSNHGGFGRHDGRRNGNRNNDGVFIYDYYREYQGDTAWKSDSFNDWWHDRPDRAYPAWMRNNQNCARKWWGADALRC